MPQIRKSPSHLLRVGTIYHFRYTIPRQYQEYASGEVRLSLRTGYLKVARDKAVELTSLTRNFLKRIAEDDPVIKEKGAIKAELSKILRENLDKHELIRINGSTVTLKSPAAGEKPETTVGEMLDYFEKDIRSQLKGQGGRGRVDVAELLERAGLKNISQDSPIFEYARRELLIAHHALIRIERERMEGNYNSSTELSLLSQYPDNPPSEPENIPKQKSKRSPRLSKAISQFVEESISDNKWAPKSIIDYKNRLALLPEVMGDCLLSEIDHKKTRRFFDDLKRLPPNRSKIKAYRGKSIDQLKKMKLPPEKCMSARTVNNTMQAAHSFFDWAVQRDKMEKNYASGMRVKQTKRPDESKERFKEDDLKTLFGSLTKSDGHKYWIPLIGIYSGARLEEICQLHITDIRQEDGVWIFDINDDGDKKLKTLNAKRIIPVHKVLLDNGLLEYANEVKGRGNERLFYELKKIDNKYGHYFTRSFARQLEKLGIRAPGRKISFHSLRHTFITKAKYSDLPEDYIKEIVGHSNKSITFGYYGKRYKASKLKEVIDQVVFDLTTK